MGHEQKGIQTHIHSLGFAENKALGYYHIIDHDELDKDVDKFLAG